MTYIDYLNDFNRWLESGNLPGGSQLMYFKLLNVFNTAPQAGQICSGSCCINGVSHRTQYSSPAIQSASFLLGPGETVAFGTAVGES